MAKDEDLLLARALMQHGVLTKDKLAQCLKVVDQREALDIGTPLADVVQELGFATAEALAPLLAGGAHAPHQPAPPPPPTPAAAPAPGGALPSELGGFKLIAQIGRGALGTVWQAEQLSLAKRVAVKVLKPELASRTDLVEGFLREARAAATLVHPNVVQAIAAGEDKGFFYFAMEYVEGRNLLEVLRKRGTLSERDALFVARKIAEGLSAAARCGLVHRDIKPANILVAADGTVKIADFGLAHTPSVDAPGWGTPDYMAPEQVTGQERVDVRSDLYALGATLFHLLAGRPPFTAPTVKEVMFARTSRDAPDVRTLRPDASPRVAALIARLLAREPRNRYQLPQEVVSEIAAILDPPTATPAAAPSHARPGAPARARAPMTAPVHRSHAPRPAGRAHDELEEEEEAPRPAPRGPRNFTIMGLVAGVLVGILVIALEMRSDAATLRAKAKASFEAKERAVAQEAARTRFREAQEKIDQDFAQALAQVRAQARTPAARATGCQELVARFPTARGLKEAADELEKASAAAKVSTDASAPATQAADLGSTEVRALLNQGEPYKANERLVNLPPEAKAKLGAQYQALIAECERAVETLARDAMAKARAAAAAGKRDEARQILEAAGGKVDPDTRKELNALIEELCGTKE
jgi:hypothetical protein